MSLHADVSIPARDRRRLERLCRYVARPSLANERLDERPDGGLLLRLKTRWRDGTTDIAMERSELIDRLVPLIPPPRAHLSRDPGAVREPAQPGRADAAIRTRTTHHFARTSEGRRRPDGNSPREDDADRRPRRLARAALLQRVFALGALRCPRCA